MGEAFGAEVINTNGRVSGWGAVFVVPQAERMRTKKAVSKIRR